MLDLKFKDAPQIDAKGDKLYLEDATGDYDATSNVGGFGAPNDERDALAVYALGYFRNFKGVDSPVSFDYYNELTFVPEPPVVVVPPDPEPEPDPVPVLSPIASVEQVFPAALLVDDDPQTVVFRINLEDGTSAYYKHPFGYFPDAYVGLFTADLLLDNWAFVPEAEAIAAPYQLPVLTIQEIFFLDDPADGGATPDPTITKATLVTPKALALEDAPTTTFYRLNLSDKTVQYAQTTEPISILTGGTLADLQAGFPTLQVRTQADVQTAPYEIAAEVKIPTKYTAKLAQDGWYLFSQVWAKVTTGPLAEEYFDGDVVFDTNLYSLVQLKEGLWVPVKPEVLRGTYQEGTVLEHFHLAFASRDLVTINGDKTDLYINSENLSNKKKISILQEAEDRTRSIIVSSHYQWCIGNKAVASRQMDFLSTNRYVPTI